MVALTERFVGQLHVSVWHGAATEDDVEALRAIVEDRDERCALLLVVPAQTPLSTGGARQAAIRFVRERQSQLAGVAIALEGEGFWKAAVRGMFVGISAGARSGVPWQIHGDAHAACAWVSDAMEMARIEPPSFLELVHIVAELRNTPPRSRFPSGSATLP